MLRKLDEIRRPVRIDRPVRLKITADPLQEVVPRVPLGDFHTVVNTDNSNPLIGQLVYLFQVLIHRVSRASVGIHYQAIDAR